MKWGVRRCPAGRSWGAVGVDRETFKCLELNRSVRGILDTLLDSWVQQIIRFIKKPQVERGHQGGISGTRNSPPPPVIVPVCLSSREQISLESIVVRADQSWPEHMPGLQGQIWCHHTPHTTPHLSISQYVNCQLYHREGSLCSVRTDSDMKKSVLLVHICPCLLYVLVTKPVNRQKLKGVKIEIYVFLTLASQTGR